MSDGEFERLQATIALAIDLADASARAANSGRTGLAEKMAVLSDALIEAAVNSAQPK